VSDDFLVMRGVKKSFGLKPVLRSLDLTLQAGQHLALLGNNGAGKTTLLRILAGLVRPEGGLITLAGLDITRQLHEIRRKVGFVAHQANVYDELTALENLIFFARMYTVEHPEKRAKKLLERVGLQKKAGERVGGFSHGQRQRLALARALLHTPELLLLDEPDNGLDQTGLVLLDELLQEHLERGGTLMFTTHDLEWALKHGDQIAFLDYGRIVHQQATVNLNLVKLHAAYDEVMAL
jgi:heme ABC exporter ATP-binding subunit CcmA